MTPYAYSILDYDSSKVYPTLDAAVRSLIGAEPWRYVTRSPVQAHFLDGTEAMADLMPYIETREVDLVVIETEIDRLREESRKRAEAAEAEWRAHHGNRPRILATGSWWPTHEMDRQHLIDSAVARARYTWKPEYLPKTVSA